MAKSIATNMADVSTILLGSNIFLLLTRNELYLGHNIWDMNYMAYAILKESLLVPRCRQYPVQKLM